MKITTHICKTLDLGVSGNLFGGQLMYWLDEAASVYAIWATGEKRIVTRRISEAFFNKPIHAGELLVFNCVEPRKGKTSFSFKVLVVVGCEIRFQHVDEEMHSQKPRPCGTDPEDIVPNMELSVRPLQKRNGGNEDLG